MDKTVQDTKKQIIDIIKQLDSFWIKKNYNAMSPYIADEVTIAIPNSTERIIGKENYINSFIQFDESAMVTLFQRDDPQVDIIEDIVVCLHPFYIEYTIAEKNYKESGKEILIFRQQSGIWKVIWRNIDYSPSP
ncbi:MAG: hypothetical protein Kow00108_17930 [Calditrichia bacterium]